jgi:ribosomal protein S18 acetylase RimI-like enzyme
MAAENMLIKPYSSEYGNAVISLWVKCGLLRPWNDPRKDIDRKQKINPELFLLGFVDGKVVASVMAGYEGHRGWMNYLAVDPDHQGNKLGTQIIAEAQKKLETMGCPKINVLIREDNMGAVKFYESAGYKIDNVTSMGKRLVDDCETEHPQ